MPQITGEQKLTTLGLLGATAGAVLCADQIPHELIVTGAIAFGTGVAISNGFYRVAELLKNGRSEKNEFWKGALAGISLFCGLMGLKSIPYVLKTLTATPFTMTPQGVWLSLGVFGLAGFLQNRNTFMSFVTEEMEREKEKE